MGFVQVYFQVFTDPLLNLPVFPEALYLVVDFWQERCKAGSLLYGSVKSIYSGELGDT